MNIHRLQMPRSSLEWGTRSGVRANTSPPNSNLYTVLDWPSSKEAHPIHYSMAVWKDDIEGQILFQTLMRAKLNTEDYPPHAAASFVCQYVRAYLDRQLQAGSVFVFVCSIDFFLFLHSKCLNTNANRSARIRQSTYCLQLYYLGINERILSF